MQLYEFDFEEAASYVLSFGQYPGRTLRQIFFKPGGIAYLRWLSQSTDNEFLRYKIEHCFFELRHEKVAW